MTRVFITFIVVWCVILFIAYLIMAPTFKGLNNHTEDVKSKIGKKIVLDKDTLTILDASIIKGTYTLSDGREVNIVLADSTRIIK